MFPNQTNRLWCPTEILPAGYQGPKGRVTLNDHPKSGKWGFCSARCPTSTGNEDVCPRGSRELIIHYHNGEVDLYEACFDRGGLADPNKHTDYETFDFKFNETTEKPRAYRSWLGSKAGDSTRAAMGWRVDKEDGGGYGHVREIEEEQYHMSNRICLG